MKIIFLLAFVLANHSYSSESAEIPSFSSPDEWRISSPAFEIYWGMNGEDTYISVIDCRVPTGSTLILSDEITAENKTLFEEIHAKNLKEASDDTESFKDLTQKIASLAKPASPISDDSSLLDLMSHSPGLVWTGSGISLQSGIPTLPDLYGKLNLTPIPYTHAVEAAGLREMAADIGLYQEILFDFLRVIFHAKTLSIEPSPAHHSIGGILKLLPTSHYITSNLDHLEDSLGYTGTVKFEVKKPFSESSFIIKSSEVALGPQLFMPSWVLMVGLRADDYRIVSWATEKGIPIYYVNPNAPELCTFTGESLLPVQWIRAYAQEYLPGLLERLRKKMKKPPVAGAGEAWYD